jgi:hypothetical protein
MTMTTEPTATKTQVRAAIARLTGKNVVRTVEFRSSSGDSIYMTQVLADGTMTCNCPGWTRRNPPTGRTCKHTERL